MGKSDKEQNISVLENDMCYEKVREERIGGVCVCM